MTERGILANSSTVFMAKKKGNSELPQYYGHLTGGGSASPEGLMVDRLSWLDLKVDWYTSTAIKSLMDA